MRWFLPFLICAIGSLQAMAKAAPPASKEQAASIGVRTLKYEDEKRGRPVLVELWHPTGVKGPIDQPSDPVWEHPKEVRNVPLSEGKFPIVIMSHGHVGDCRDRSWLAGYLVASGFIVASVEHHGNSWRSYSPLLTLKFWERAKDISFAIDQLLKDPVLEGKIDPARIGFVGYSLGGMTGLALGGAQAENVAEVIQRERSQFAEIDPDVIGQIDFSEAQGNFADLRIKALALLCPAAFIFPPHSLKEVKVPVALVASEGDEVLPFKDHAMKIITHLVPAKVKLLKAKASHYVILNRVSEKGKDLLRKDIQTDTIQSDRLTVHREVGSFVSDFFQERL